MNDAAKGLSDAWLWLFPLAYVAHAIEETWAGVGYASWVSALNNIVFTDLMLIVAHVLLLAGMCTVIAFVSRAQRFWWAIVAFAVIYVGNAGLHLGASLYTDSYSPGLLTGVLVWLPLGVVVLARANRDLSRSDMIWGVVLGVAGTLIVSMVALDPGLLPRI